MSLKEYIPDPKGDLDLITNNFEEEKFDSREARDKRWEELMLVKPHVVRGSTSDWFEEQVKDGAKGEIRRYGKVVWFVRYPRLVI